MAIICIDNPIIASVLSIFVSAVTLDHSTILQVNATMIVGILVFMSFSNEIFIGNVPSDVVNKFSNTNLTVTSIENQALQSYLEQRGQSSQVYFTVLILIPIAVSCLFIVYYDYKHDEDDESEKIFRKRSILSMLVGFGMLIASILSKKVSRNAT